MGEAKNIYFTCLNHRPLVFEPNNRTKEPKSQLKIMATVDMKVEDCACEEQGFDATKFADSQGPPAPQPCYLPGNVVFSCTAPPPHQQPNRSSDPWFNGYGGIPQNPLYRTTANDYGGGIPNVRTMPATFHGTSNAFSQHLSVCGPYRDHGLNTSSDKSRVPDH